MAFKFDVGVNVQSWLIFEILTRSINDAQANKNKRGRWASGRRHREFDFRCRCKGKDARRNDISWVKKKSRKRLFTGDSSFIQRKTSQYKQSWSAGLQTVPRPGGYFYSVPNNDLLFFSYDGSHFASSLEISVEDKIKRGKSPRIHLAVFLRGSRSSGRPFARSLLYCLHVLPLLRAIPASCNTTLCCLQLKWFHILGWNFSYLSFATVLTKKTGKISFFCRASPRRIDRVSSFDVTWLLAPLIFHMTERVNAQLSN